MQFKELEWKDIISEESAKTAAYKIYNNEMARIKKVIDYLGGK